MENESQKSDITLLLEQLQTLLDKAENKSDYKHLEFELEILKIKSELVKLYQEGGYKESQALQEAELHKNALEYQYKTAQWQQKSINYRNKMDVQAKMISEAVGFAKIAINSLVIISAGAVLSILAFLGNVIRAGAGCKVGDIDFISFFIASTSFAVLTACFGYFAQICFSSQSTERLQTWAHSCRILAIIFAALSFFFFVSASLTAVNKFNNNEVINCKNSPDFSIRRPINNIIPHKHPSDAQPAPQ